MTASTTNPVYEQVTAKVMALLDKGVIPWVKPWDYRNVATMPSNPLSGTVYGGANAWLLLVAMLSEGYTSPHFATFIQIKEKGGKLENAKGKGIHLLRYVPIYENMKEVSARVGDKLSQDSYMQERRVKFNKPVAFVVFNFEHVTGIEVPAPATPAITKSPIERCEDVLNGMQEKPIIYPGTDKAFYSPTFDLIEMPPFVSFKTAEHYYATLFHELGHWTGTKTRLNREGVIKGGQFGSKIYAREELVAEMTAAMLCGVTGIDNLTIENTVAYCQSWLKTLKNDPSILLQAASQAMIAANFILGIREEDKEEEAAA